MQKLKNIYNIKKQFTNNIYTIGDILKSINSIQRVDIHPDNTIYLESNCGMDSIKENVNESIKNLIGSDQHIIYEAVFNTLPLSNNSCIIRI